MAKRFKWSGSLAASAAADATSDPITVKPNVYYASIQYIWTGTATGLLQPQVSLDGLNWTSMADTLDFAGYGEVSPAGSPGAAVRIITLASVFVRVVFTRSGGTGSLSAWLQEVVQ